MPKSEQGLLQLQQIPGEGVGVYSCQHWAYWPGPIETSAVLQTGKKTWGEERRVKSFSSLHSTTLEEKAKLSGKAKNWPLRRERFHHWREWHYEVEKIHGRLPFCLRRVGMCCWPAGRHSGRGTRPLSWREEGIYQDQWGQSSPCLTTVPSWSSGFYSYFLFCPLECQAAPLWPAWHQKDPTMKKCPRTYVPSSAQTTLPMNHYLKLTPYVCWNKAIMVLQSRRW